MADTDGFLSRWSRRKAQARDGVDDAPAETPTPPIQPEPTPPAPVADALPEAVPAPPPPPTLDDAAALTPDDDFRRFVAPEVGPEVRNTALKKLFADPHFNVMDGLDIYIDDYSRPDPLPASMLRRMAQTSFLNLFADEKPGTPAPPAPETAGPEDDEDPAVRLQPDDAAGPPGAGQGAGEDPGDER